MTEPFHDHFSSVARRYAESRPTYPRALFAWLAEQCPHHDLAWDCACGGGQASVGLAEHFRRVIATDASAEQIVHAATHPGVEYRVAPASASGLDDQTVDLVTVAQALHWFDLGAFYTEVRRVLKPNGLLAVWCYGILHVEGAALDAALLHFYRDILGPYWPPERTYVENGYRDLPFPFTPITQPPFTMELNWTLDQLLAYLRTWSATARYIATHQQDPVNELAATLAPLWGDVTQPRTVTWPVTMRVGRIF